MNGKSKLRALGVALGMVGAAAGTGWALQLPLTAMVADVGPIDVPRVPALADMPAPGLAAPAPIRAVSADDTVGLEEMSATGAAWVQR